jgi:hypothetical protein
MGELLLAALAMWIVTHTVAVEIPITANAPKPLSCQLCLSGWGSMMAGAIGIISNRDITYLWSWLAIWAMAVLIEALYRRLNVFML